MNWNEWRGYCAEEGLTAEDTRDSWKNYKKMRQDARDAAILGFETVAEYQNYDVESDEEVPIQEQIREVAESINEAISEALEEEDNNEENLLSHADEQLFLDLEDDSKDILESFANIKDRIEYYEARAKILRREADEAADQYARDIRRSLD